MSADSSDAIPLFGRGNSGKSVVETKEERRVREKREAGPWLNSWHDPMANVHAFSSQTVRLSDVHMDGQHRLLVADADRKLKVYKGTALASEHALLDVPQAMVSYYDNSPSGKGNANIPCVAVACGPFIFIHRGLRPYYKFPLPKADVHVNDKEAWENLKSNNKIDGNICETFTELLVGLRKKGIPLSNRSKDFLDVDSLQAKIKFIDGMKYLPLENLTLVSCMETIQDTKDVPDSFAVSRIVFGM